MRISSNSDTPTGLYQLDYLILIRIRIVVLHEDTNHHYPHAVISRVCAAKAVSRTRVSCI